ncbi:MAG TPA: MFS transporter [Nocardioidaceae bacterium]|nr:MFS transporter [Nocardioidaceae bacterium]
MPPPPSPRKVALASAVGATIEWYDFFLYGTAAGLVFNQLFFTRFDSTVGTLIAFGTFAVGFLARPLGGLVFGHFGDRLGRKRMLVLTLLIMGGSTTVIGLLPTYDAIGVWAPLLLVAMRVLQGIGVGGEYGGAVLMAVEYAPDDRRAFYGSFAHIGVPAGLLLASGAFGLVSLLPEQAFLAWGWRATFLASLVLLAVGAYIRLNVLETPAFASTRRDAGVLRVPVVEVWRRHKRTMLLAMGTRWVEGFTFNVYSVFLLSYAANDLGLGAGSVLGGVMLGAAVGIAMVPLSGRLADRFGRRPVYRAGVWASVVLAFPSFWLVQTGDPALVWVSLVTGLGLLYGVICAPLAAFWAELFDTRIRYTAIGTIYQVSGIVASGLTPLIAAWLVARNSGQPWLLATYAVAVSLVSLLCMRGLPETHGRELVTDLQAGTPRQARTAAAREHEHAAA